MHIAEAQDTTVVSIVSTPATDPHLASQSLFDALATQMDESLGLLATGQVLRYAFKDLYYRLFKL